MLRKLLNTLFTAAALLASVITVAEPTIATAKVEILPALDVRQETAIDFGQIRNSSGTCTMSANGALSGTDGMECTGQETPGSFVVTGTQGNIIDVSVTGGSEDGVFFAPRIDGSKQRALANGIARVTILGSLQLDQTSPGTKQISYTFTANYN
ncbi:MAG: DUF4402 domain-containing protein [Pseudomonadales bacterium]